MCKLCKTSRSLWIKEAFSLFWSQWSRLNHNSAYYFDIIKPDSGKIEWNLTGEINALPEAAHIDYLPEECGLYLDIPILKSLVYLASIKGMEPSWRELFKLLKES